MYPSKRIYFRIERPDGSYNAGDDSVGPCWFHGTVEDAELAKAELEADGERDLVIIRVENSEDLA